MATIQLWADPQRVLDAGHSLAVSPGSCQPYGASCPPGCNPIAADSRLNLALFSQSARDVSVLFHEPDTGALVLELKLDELMHQTGHVWHVEVRGLKRPVRYSWRLDGVQIADPWSSALLKVPGTPHPVYHAFYPLPPHEWSSPRPVRKPLQDLVIYELNVRGFTKHPSSGVAHPGTYLGLAEKIPYLKDLGVSAVELMPVHEFDPDATIFHNPATGEKLRNFWGYDPVGLMAPVAHYATGGHPLEAAREFRTMVDAFHAAGIEVLLDVVLNHTGEGSPEGPTLHFRGMDEQIWYMHGEDGRYLDFTGCGNTVNCNHPVVREYLLHCLRRWVTEFGVDGFRFDLASVMGRSRSGKVLPNAPVLEQITLDPVLADSRLIAEAWDAAGLYQVGSFDAGLPRKDSIGRPGGGWAQWNGRFRDDIRRLVRGDTGMTGAGATRLGGSSDIFQWNGRGPAGSLNFITCHDGFTLADLVSYEQKRNEANGEDNRDGMNENLSWNCGAEGFSEDRHVLQLRKRQQRNLLTLLFLAQGTPMLLAGDEFGRSQQGNNNAWCQDNELSWVDWSLLKSQAGLHRFTRTLIELRKRFGSLRRDHFLTGDDVEWHGTVPFKPDFGPGSRVLAMRLRGVCEGGRKREPDLYLACNFWSGDLSFQPPAAGPRRSWHKLLDSSSRGKGHSDPAKAPPHTGTLLVKAHSLVLLATN